MEIKGSAAVNLSPNAVQINGEPVILLSASLFYFRIPRAYWRERMEQVKAYGYTCIDVYFPWNFHEAQEGVWDFAGERDAEEFLRIAAQVGLWVIARPGPYICSEWDGGALPAYLLAKPDIHLRSDNSEYLQAVSRWFAKILPILRRYDVDQGGTVVAVQLENELDFYDCPAPAAYIAALRDIAQRYAIRAPLIACAGQGGLVEASGRVPDVVPACNFYPDDRDPDFEHKVLHYRDRLAGMGYPLLVTETNRSHYLLRRLLSTGAKLLGPYLQVSGTNFGFTNATNNWGKTSGPLAFLASDYDFGGMISPEGLIRSEAYEGRLLSRIIQTYGQALAAGYGESSSEWLAGPNGNEPGVIGPQMLKLEGQGQLLFVTNGEDVEKEVVLHSRNARKLPETGELSLPAGRSLILPVDVPLSLWGLAGAGTIAHASLELYLSKTDANGAVLAFHHTGPGEIGLELMAPAANIQVDNAVVCGRAGAGGPETRLTIAVEGTGAGKVVITLAQGQILTLLAVPLEDALYTEEIDEDGCLQIAKVEPDQVRLAAVTPTWAVADFESAAAMDVQSSSREHTVALSDAVALERQGIYQGYAWYEADIPQAQPHDPVTVGLLVADASDVVSLYAGGAYATTLAPGGGSRYVPLASGAGDGRLTARVEIWGHSNFDDARLPGLRLSAMKGISGLTAVNSCRNLTGNWRVYRSRERALNTSLITPEDDALWPVVTFGNWMSPDHPAHEVYRRGFQADAAADRWVIHFRNIQSLARLFVNGREVGEVHPFNPYLDITPYVRAGEQVQLTVYLERVLGLSAGEVWLYEGRAAVNWRLTSAREEELLAHAATTRRKATSTELPLTLEPGATAWLYGELPASATGRGYRVQVTGSGMKLSILFAGQLVGRLWLPGGEERPTVTGGSADSFYVPGAWMEEEKVQLTILLEAVDPAAPGELTALVFHDI
jgi:beta-galactosidase